MNNFKNFLTVILIFLINLAFACDACKLQQPAVTRDFTHGVGPTGEADWIIVAVIGLITVYTFIFSLKYLVKPGEKEKSHIKNSILN